jgi:hypothetical protein
MSNRDDFSLMGIWEINIYDNGKLRKTITEKNLVVNTGINYVLSSGLGASLYVGLTDGTPVVAAGDTLASHGGWDEVSAYSGNRPLWDKTISGVSASNSGSTASFASFTGSGTIGGLFLASVNTGTSGTLISAVAFTEGDQSYTSATTVTATYTLSGASS